MGEWPMALYKYFHTVGIPPAPSESLSTSVSPTAIKDAIEAVRSWAEISRQLGQAVTLRGSTR